MRPDSYHNERENVSVRDRRDRDYRYKLGRRFNFPLLSEPTLIWEKARKSHTQHEFQQFHRRLVLIKCQRIFFTFKLRMPIF